MVLGSEHVSVAPSRAAHREKAKATVQHVLTEDAAHTEGVCVSVCLCLWSVRRCEWGEQSARTTAEPALTVGGCFRSRRKDRVQ